MSAEDPRQFPPLIASGESPKPSNPWLGLAPYSEKDVAMFFGRERETAEVLRMIERDALTVVFGRSGLGKTSLLRAGVIPQLRELSYFPIALRLDYSGKRLSPVQQLMELTREASGINRVSVENDPEDDKEITLWEFFHTTEFWSSRNDQLTPVLLIDQFEEVFTIGRNVRGVSEFLEQLADLIENRIPRAVQERVEQSGKPLRIDAGVRNYKIVLSLREDFVSKLDSLRSAMPAIMRNRFALNPLSAERALSVIVQNGGEWVAEDVARDIVAAVAGNTESNDSSLEFSAHAEIEPAYLSVMCHELFQRMLALDRTAITRDLVKQEHGGILEGLYERSFEGLDPAVRVFVEDRLLTPSGFRAAIPVAEALSEKLTPEDLEVLVDRRLLRFEDRLGTSHVELSHDLLTRVVLRSRDQRRARHALEVEALRQIELRRAFRARLRTAFIVAGVVVLFFGGLALWAVREQIRANRALTVADVERKDANDAKTRAEDSLLELKRQEDALKVETKHAEEEGLKALAAERKAEQSNQDMQTERKTKQQLEGKIMLSAQKATNASYEDSLKLVDLYNKNLDENVKEQINASVRAHASSLREALNSIDAVLNADPDDPGAMALKMEYLFEIADLDSRAYGFKEEEYRDFLNFTRKGMSTQKDVAFHLKALRKMAQAAGIMYRKPDVPATEALLKEVSKESNEYLNRSDHPSLSAANWDALEDAYEVCAHLQESRDAKDARAWYGLAAQAEINAANLDHEYQDDVVLILRKFGSFELDQKDPEAATHQYTLALDASKSWQQTSKDQKAGVAVMLSLNVRGDAEIKASHVDAARKDFEESLLLAAKLEDTTATRYQKLVSLERLGDLDVKAKDLKAALQVFKQEQEIDLALAKNDPHSRHTVTISYDKVCNVLHELGDLQGERAEREREVAYFKQWSMATDESSQTDYVDVLMSLGDLDDTENHITPARTSYERAAAQADQLALRWPTAANQKVQYRALRKAAIAASDAKDSRSSMDYLQQSLQVAENLPENEGRDLRIAASQIQIGGLKDQQNDQENARKSYQQAVDLMSKIVASNCADNISLFSSAETGALRSLAYLKREKEAQAEGLKAVDLANGSCKTIDEKSEESARTDLASFWGNLAWGFSRAGDDKDALMCADKGTKLDPSQLWIRLNLAHAYLFTGRVDEAKQLYSQLKDQKRGDHLMAQEIRADFKELRSLGRDNPEMDAILGTLDPGK